MELNKLVFTSALIITASFSNTAELAIFELPETNLQAAFEHQKELVGSKKALTNPSQKADQVISQLVYNITLTNLPKNYKKDAHKISSAIIQEANKYGMDPLFLLSVIKQESSFRPDVVGGVGEIGLMQIRPSTAKWLNEKAKIVKTLNLKNPITNIKIGAYYLNKLRGKFDQNGRWYLSAYNMGAAKVKRKLAANEKPKEYVQHVMKHYVKYVAMLNTVLDESKDELELIEMPLPKVASNN